MEAQAQFIARYILTPNSLHEDQPTPHLPEVDPATGAPEDWRAQFNKTVAPAIRHGYKYITETRDHKIELVGFAKILVDGFFKENFLSIATTVTTNDLSKLNWGRIIALFTFLSFVSADLAEKDKHDDVTTLEQWLTEFLNREDISCWVANKGGWISIACPSPSRGHETASWWWTLLQPLRNLIDNFRADSEHEKAVVCMREVGTQTARHQEQQEDKSQMDRIEEKVGRNTDLELTNHRQLEKQVGDNADLQLWQLKSLHDGQVAQAEGFSHVDGQMAKYHQQDCAEYQKNRKEIRKLGQQECEQHRKTREVVKELGDKVEDLVCQLSRIPLPVEDPPPDHNYLT